jgi:hypothetical protein
VQCQQTKGDRSWAPPGAVATSEHTACDAPAARARQVLTRAAVDRGSRDNVTVVVVDLSVGGSEADALARTPSAAVAEDADADGGDDALPPDLLRSRSQVRCVVLCLRYVFRSQ